jgi:hypothetical protein
MNATTVAVRRASIAAAGAALLFACSEGPTDPSVPRSELSITGADPSPSAPGIFLGTITPEVKWYKNGAFVPVGIVSPWHHPATPLRLCFRAAAGRA